jgi:hypothetical protein
LVFATDRSALVYVVEFTPVPVSVVVIFAPDTATPSPSKTV